MLDWTGSLKLQERKQITTHCHSLRKARRGFFRVRQNTTPLALAILLNVMPHAHRCLQHVPSLASMPEALAHLCLCLLQVLEYISTVDHPAVVERLAVEKAHAVIDHAERFGEAADGYLRYSATLWRLTRAAICNCQRQAAEMLNRCDWCRQAIEGVVRLMEDVIANHLERIVLQESKQRHWAFSSPPYLTTERSWIFSKFRTSELNSRSSEQIGIGISRH